MNELRRQIQELQQQLEAQNIQQGQNENQDQDEEFKENPFHDETLSPEVIECYVTSARVF